MWNKIRGFLRVLSGHLTGLGIGAVTVAMALTVSKGMAGQETGFDPGDISLSFSSSVSGVPDRTGYDLSGEGEDSEEVNHDPDHEPDENQEEEQEESQGLDEAGSMDHDRGEQVILPEGLAGRFGAGRRFLRRRYRDKWFGEQRFLWGERRDTGGFGKWGPRGKPRDPAGGSQGRRLAG